MNLDENVCCSITQQIQSKQAPHAVEEEMPMYGGGEGLGAAPTTRGKSTKTKVGICLAALAIVSTAVMVLFVNPSLDVDSPQQQQHRQAAHATSEVAGEMRDEVKVNQMPTAVPTPATPKATKAEAGTTARRSPISVDASARGGSSCAATDTSNLVVTWRTGGANARKECAKRLQDDLGNRWFQRLSRETIRAAGARERRPLATAMKKNEKNVPLLIYNHWVAKTGRMERGQELFRKYIFEFYGDSTLRRTWQSVIEAYGGGGGLADFKKLVNVSYRGPHYQTQPIVRGKAIDNAKDPSVGYCALCPDVHRSFFRFDFKNEDLESPEVRTTQPPRIPKWFLPSSTARDGEYNTSSHQESTNNRRPKLVFFTFGIHYVFQFVTNTTLGKDPTHTFAQGSAYLNATLYAGLRSYLKYFATRKNAQFVTFVESKLDCVALGFPKSMMKKALSSIDCNLFNKYVEFLSEMVMDAAKETPMGAADAPQTTMIEEGDGGGGPGGGGAGDQQQQPTEQVLRDRLLVFKAVDFDLTTKIGYTSIENRAMTSDAIHLKWEWQGILANSLMHFVDEATKCLAAENVDDRRSVCGPGVPGGAE